MKKKKNINPDPVIEIIPHVTESLPNTDVSDDILLISHLPLIPVPESTLLEQHPVVIENIPRPSHHPVEFENLPPVPESTLLEQHPVEIENIPTVPKNISSSRPPVHFLVHRDSTLLVDSINDKNHKCLILLMLDAGLRVSEAISLKLGDIDFQKRNIHVRSLKKRDSKNFANRIIPLSNRLFISLSEYVSTFRVLDRNSFLFPSPLKPDSHICRQAVFNYLKRLNLKKLNIENLHPHTLRHSFATGLVATGADLHRVADLLGHQSLDTSRIYAHIPEDQLSKSVASASVFNGAKRGFYSLFSFLFAKRPPFIYVPNQKNSPIVGRGSALSSISSHLEKGTNVIVFGNIGVGKRLLLDSVQSSKKILTFDDTSGIKKSLVYLLLYLYKNDKEAVAKVLFRDFDLDPAKAETRLSRQSVSFLCNEIKSIIEPKEYILKIKQFDDITKQSLKVIEELKDTFVILTAATEIAVTKAPFFWNFEKFELKNLNRQQSFELIHKLSCDLDIEDYEIFRNHIWLQTDGNPKAITEMVERYRREPRLVADNIRAVTFAGAIKEWDCSYAVVILIASLAVMRYMTSELDNPAFRFIGGMSMIFLLMARAFVARSKRKYI